MMEHAIKTEDKSDGNKKASNGTFTQKERLLLDQIRQTFHDLGPEAMQLMELIVTKSNSTTSSNETSAEASVPSEGHPPKQKLSIKKKGQVESPRGLEKSGELGGIQSVPSLRRIERFFLGLNDSQVAYWRVSPVKVGETIVPAEICAGDASYRNDFHVTPVHVFASLKRMATQWQKRYVDNFRRRTEALDWPFPTTICQANFFGWLFSEDLLHRLDLLDKVNQSLAEAKSTSQSPQEQIGGKRQTPDGKAPKNGSKKKKKTANGIPAPGAGSGEEEEHDQDHDEPAKGAKRPRELYLYHYPRYIPRPPIEGASPENPLQLLPLMVSTSDVVERHYASIVDRLLFHTAIVREPDHAQELFASDALPFLAPPIAVSADPNAPCLNPGMTWRDSPNTHLVSRSKSMYLAGDPLAGSQAEAEIALIQDGTGLPEFLFETLPSSLRAQSPIHHLPLMAMEEAPVTTAELAVESESGANIARVDVTQRARGMRSFNSAAYDWIADKHPISKLATSLTKNHQSVHLQNSLDRLQQDLALADANTQKPTKRTFNRFDSDDETHHSDVALVDIFQLSEPDLDT